MLVSRRLEGGEAGQGEALRMVLVVFATSAGVSRVLRPAADERGRGKVHVGSGRGVTEGGNPLLRAISGDALAGLQSALAEDSAARIVDVLRPCETRAVAERAWPAQVDRARGHASWETLSWAT